MSVDVFSPRRAFSTTRIGAADRLRLESVVQGNVLKAFARENAIYFFVHFDNDAGRVAPLLKCILLTFVTSAARQIAVSREPVGMIGLSATGYSRLNLTKAAPTDRNLGVRQFQNGMKERYRSGLSPDEYFWDPQLDSWEEGYRDYQIDAFLLLADDDAVRLQTASNRAREALSDIGVILAEERGSRLRSPLTGNWDIEHYGYREGVGKVPERERVFSPERLRNGRSEEGFGCFAAFLKLEQNVLRFMAATEELAALASRETSRSIEPRQIRDRAVGRRPDGEPLAAGRGQNMDDFTFDRTPESVCPYHAHIRVMNPRGQEPVPAILRRGMAYGPQRGDLSAAGLRQLPPSSGSGLLFLSFQRSLTDFRALMAKAQQKLDPILARGSNGGRGQKWLIGERDVYYPLTDLTTVRGGEYFYIPSMRFIDTLA